MLELDELKSLHIIVDRWIKIPYQSQLLMLNKQAHCHNIGRKYILKIVQPVMTD